MSEQDQLIIQRALLLEKAEEDHQLREALKVKCESDAVFWVNNFVWTYDPRRTPQRVPMSVEGDFAYQKACIKKILECIEGGKDLRIEKSRDVGMSWTIIVLFVWGWLFKGWDTIVGSKSADSVDKLNNLKTLLPKARYVISSLPKWMQPEGFSAEKHMGYMNIFNPEKGCSISGEANSTTFATGGRAKAILFDEFAKWEHTDRDAWTSAAAASPCRIAVSTPLYKNNKFYELIDTDIENLKVHFSQNPAKGKEWIEQEKKKYSDQEWAQEMDINYSGTAHAVVFAEELQMLRDNNRISERVQFIPRKPVYISMDLGMGDLTTVLCWQKIGYNEELWMFEEYSNSNKPIHHYIEWIKSPDRLWNIDESGRYHEGWRDVLVIPDPNQASNRELTSGKSVEQLFAIEELQVEMRWVGKREGTSLAKKRMKDMWITPNAVELIESLEGWHYDYDNKRGEYKPEPVHDKFSHFCKALIYFCAWLDEDVTPMNEDSVHIPKVETHSMAGW